MKYLYVLFLATTCSLRADNHFNAKERTISSQSGEDGIIEEIFSLIGTQDKFFVDIGAGDGKSISNTFFLRKKGWKGIGFDGAYNVPSLNIIQQRISAENIADLLVHHGVREEFDFLSLDIDSIDFYVLKEILKNGFRPRCICAEYNANFKFDEDAVVLYDPELRWDGGHYYGASYAAFKNLVSFYGYQPVCTNKWGVNVFFIRNDLMPKLSSVFIGIDKDIYHKGGYGNGPNGGHPLDKKHRAFTSSITILNN